ncbi:hypothetical protein TeGR_g2039, partial [Tetraparma gracilis]
MHVTPTLNGHRSSSVTTVPCANTPLNSRMDRAVESMVKAVEKQQKGRVVGMTTEFVVDVSNNVWVVSTSDLRVAAEPSDATRNKKTTKQRSKGRKDQQEAMQMKMKEEETKILSSKPGAYLPPSFDGSSVPGGAGVEARLERRRMRDNEKTADSDVVARILAEDSFHQAGSPVKYARANPSSPRTSASSPLKLDSPSGSRAGTAESFPAQSAAAAAAHRDRKRTSQELSALHHTPAAAAMLGSSQDTCHCAGDFCSYDLLAYSKMEGLANDLQIKDSFVDTNDK